MTLDSYLKENGLTEAAFAERVGTTQPNIHRLRKHGQRPNRGLMLRIIRETGGAVQPNDFYQVGAA